MAKITLEDGRVIPAVKPHLGDQLDVERALGLKPKEFQQVLQTNAFSAAFMLYASLKRAGAPMTVEAIMEMDLEKIGKMIELEPGDKPDEDEPESEGEQTPDPQ